MFCVPGLKDMRLEETWDRVSSPVSPKRHCSPSLLSFWRSIKCALFGRVSSRDARWDLGIPWHYSSFLDYRDQFPWGELDALKGGLHSSISQWGPCSPQAPLPNLLEFPNLNLTTLPHSLLMATLVCNVVDWELLLVDPTFSCGLLFLNGLNFISG